jgi:uncharacterized membrane protein
MRLIKPNFNNPRTDLLDRLAAAACYVSGGLLGLLYVLFFKKNSRSAPLFYFHFLQSIILAILFFLFKWTSGIIGGILTTVVGFLASILPAIGPAATSFTNLALNCLFIIIQSSFCILLIYGLVFALLGKYAEIPALSKIVRQNM